MYKNKGGRSYLALGLMMLAGVVVGSFIGEVLSDVAAKAPSVSFLGFLGYGPDTGIGPVTIPLIAITLEFGIWVKFNVCAVIFMLLAILIYRRL